MPLPLPLPNPTGLDSWLGMSGLAVSGTTRGTSALELSFPK